MKAHSAPPHVGQISRRKLLALLCAAAISFIALTVAQLSRHAIGGNAVLDTGNVAPRDIRAPRRLKYISDLETNRQRELAAAAVAPIFSSPDAQIARQQLNTFRELTGKVAQIRADNATDEERVKQLVSLPELAPGRVGSPQHPGRERRSLGQDQRGGGRDPGRGAAVPHPARQPRRHQSHLAQPDQPGVQHRRSRGDQRPGGVDAGAQHQLQRRGDRQGPVGRPRSRAARRAHLRSQSDHRAQRPGHRPARRRGDGQARASAGRISPGRIS